MVQLLLHDVMDGGGESCPQYNGRAMLCGPDLLLLFKACQYIETLYSCMCPQDN